MMPGRGFPADDPPWTPRRLQPEVTPMPRSAFLFDMDGVLTDSFDVWFEVMNATARELGSPAIRREQIESTWGQGIRDDVETYYSGATLAEVQAAFLKHFEPSRGFVKMMPGADRVLDRLRATGHSVAVVTNTPRDLAEGMLVAAGLNWDEIVGGTDVPSAKPAPDMVFRALDQFGVSAESAIMVGDSTYDRDAANAAGVAFIGFGSELPIDGGEEVARALSHRELEVWFEAQGDLVAPAPKASDA